MAKQQQAPVAWHWRNTMKPVRFFMFDGRAGFFLILFIVHARKSTLFMLAVVFGYFWILERKGLSFSAALRATRVWIVGKERPAWIFTRRRKLTDTGST
jgi:intracellular multiplication protein IcmT